MSGQPLSVLLTGATGFVGGGLLDRLVADDRFACTVVARRTPAAGLANTRSVQIDNLVTDTIASDALAGVDVVVHAAAQAHAAVEDTAEALEALRQINVNPAIRLYESAARAGVKRFIFLSSIKVNGDETQPGRPFRPDDAPNPKGLYGKTKLEAEPQLQQLARAGGPELVIVRPPLVYGPGVKGNFALMIGLARRGLPLPFGLASNRRSLVALPNLVDLLLRCLDHPGAAGQTLLAGDGEDLTLAELLRRLYAAFGKRAVLLPVPPGVMRSAAGLIGQGDRAQQLLGWLQVDSTRTRELLQWQPPVGVDAALAQLNPGR
jgi:nucleoside-diphosphate-sugar epimerase